VLPTFGTTPLARVDQSSLREWAAKLSAPDGSDLAPATVVKAVQVFNKAMRAAFEDRLISANPVERLPPPRIEREETRFLTADELWQLADEIDERYRTQDLRGCRRRARRARWRVRRIDVGLGSRSPAEPIATLVLSPHRTTSGSRGTSEAQAQDDDRPSRRRRAQSRRRERVVK